MKGNGAASVLAAALLGVLTVTGCGGSADTGGGRPQAPATTEDGAGDLATVRVGSLSPLRVEVARSPDERSRGLSGRERLPQGRGMIFIFESPTTTGFWMHDVHFPLSLAWVRDGRVIGTVEMTPCTSAPEDCRTYEPPGRFDMAIEARGGVFEDVEPGAAVRISSAGGE